MCMIWKLFWASHTHTCTRTVTSGSHWAAFVMSVSHLLNIVCPQATHTHITGWSLSGLFCMLRSARRFCPTTIGKG